MRGRPTLVVGTTIVINAIVLAAVAIAPFGTLSGRDRLATVADILEIISAISACLLWLVVWRTRHAIPRRHLRILLLTSTLVGAAAALYGFWMLPTFRPGLWIALGAGLAAGTQAAWRSRTKRLARRAIIRETSAPAPTPRQMARLHPTVAADRALESRLDNARELCAPTRTTRSLAVLAFPDREKRVFRIHAVSSQSYVFQTAVRGLELPFFQIRAVANAYNKHVEAASQQEGRRVDYAERLKLYRKDLTHSASACAYTALRGKPFRFPDAYKKCLICRLEFLDEISDDEDRLRLQFTDLIGLPIITAHGTVAVVLVASVMGNRLEYPEHDLRLFGGGIGNLIDRLANTPELENHPATLAVQHAIPARPSRRFGELVRQMTPYFNQRIPEQLIVDAVEEHTSDVEGWCEIGRRAATGQN